jgi:hypothetical protein
MPPAGDEGSAETSPDGGHAGGLPPAFADPAYAEAVSDLLGALAYGELTAFDRLSEDSTTAPTTADKVALAAMACAEFGHFTQLRDSLERLGTDPYEAMEPFRETFDRFHANTRPRTWLESLVKAYVGDGLASDFYREVAAYLDEQTRTLILDVLDDSGHSAFAVDRVRAAIEADPRVGGRLALWGRRLVGEALTQAQSVASERDGLTALLAGGVDRPGMDLAAIGRMFARLTENHAKRMASLGLSA